MPTLIVLRHSKAAGALGTPDVDRPLAGRGRRDAESAGDELRAAGLVPDHVVCSAALRTRQTFEGLAFDVPVDFAAKAYSADAEELLDLLHEQDGEVVLLVGHNPSVHQLTLTLTGAAVQGFPTSATAVIEFDGEWAGLSAGDGRLVSLWTPRG